MRRKITYLVLLLIIIASLLIKLAVMRKVNYATGDAAFYSEVARSVSQSKGLVVYSGQELETGPLPASVPFNILYPLIVGSISSWTGGDVWSLSKLFNVLISTLTVLVLFFLAESLFKPVPPGENETIESETQNIFETLFAPSIIVAILVAFNSNLLLLSTLPYTDTLFIFFCCLTFYLLLKLQTKKEIIYSILLGIVISLACLARAQGLALLLFVPLSILMLKGINKKSLFIVAFIILISVSLFASVMHLNNLSSIHFLAKNLFAPTINKMTKGNQIKTLFVNLFATNLEGWKIAFSRHRGDSLFPALKEIFYIGLFGIFISIFSFVKKRKFEIWQCLWLFIVLIISSFIFLYFRIIDLPIKGWLFSTRRTYALIPVFILFAVYILNCFRKKKIVYFLLILFLLNILGKNIARDVSYTRCVPEWTDEPKVLVSAVQYLRKNLKPDDIILAPEECYFSWRTGLRSFNLSVAFNYPQLLERARRTHSDYLVIWSANDSGSKYKFLYDTDYAQNAPELKLLKEFKDETNQVTRIFKFKPWPERAPSDFKS